MPRTYTMGLAPLIVMLVCVCTCACVCVSLCVQILPVCVSWFDYVWAYFKVMVDVLTEKVSKYPLVARLFKNESMYALSFSLPPYPNFILLSHPTPTSSWLMWYLNTEAAQVFSCYWSGSGNAACRVLELHVSPFVSYSVLYFCH